MLGRGAVKVVSETRKKIALITPWENAWVPHFRKAIEARGHDFALGSHLPDSYRPDAVIHGWADGAVAPGPNRRDIVVLRRYELFAGACSKIDWAHVDVLVCVNDWIADRVRDFFAAKGIAVPVHVIYNAVDPDAWTFRERKPNKKIGMACHVHPKKNLPLALQILAGLPADYELHIAGAVQDPCTAEYLDHAARTMRRRIYLYGHVPAEHMDVWWEQMGFCLSTSISEGNPNNVIEAMAKGIRPVVHDWPGAAQQLPGGWLFAAAGDAVRMIEAGGYDSKAYRALVENRFSLANIDRVVDLALGTGGVEPKKSQQGEET